MPEINNTVKDEFLIHFGANIKRLRKLKELSQKQLAARINGDVTKISRIERGEYDFKMSSALILANALDVQICELLEFEGIAFLQKHIWIL